MRNFSNQLFTWTPLRAMAVSGRLTLFTFISSDLVLLLQISALLARMFQIEYSAFDGQPRVQPQLTGLVISGVSRECILNIKLYKKNKVISKSVLTIREQSLSALELEL